jgi:5-methylcytosine-specific restriction endonuclease McrA
MEAAWEAHRKQQYAPAGVLRREWLLRHVEKQNMRCWYCGIGMRLDSARSARDRIATIDHVVPRSANGPDSEENTVAACLECNQLKGTLSEAAFRADSRLLARLKFANTPPDRLCVDEDSPHYDAHALARDVGIRFNGKERNDVSEYCISEGWVRAPVGKTRNRNGNRVTIRIRGVVEPYYRT